MNEALFDHVAAHYDSWYDTELESVFVLEPENVLQNFLVA